MGFGVDIIKEANERLKNMSQEEFDVFFDELIDDTQESIVPDGYWTGERRAEFFDAIDIVNTLEDNIEVDDKI